MILPNRKRVISWQHKIVGYQLIEIAEHLGVSKESIYRWLERGKIPSHRVGKQWRFQTDEVNEWVRRGEASDDKHQSKYGSLSEGQHD